MKYIIYSFLKSVILSGVLFSSGQMHIVNNKYPEIQNIYINLLKHTGYTSKMVPLYIIESDVKNAEATPIGIFLFTGMIDLVKDDPDKIALILGHEMGHVYLGHIYIQRRLSMIESQEIEAQADKMGAFFMLRSGYNICKGREWLKDFNNIYGDMGFEDHPDNAYRYSQLNIGCTKDDF